MQARSKKLMCVACWATLLATGVDLMARDDESKPRQALGPFFGSNFCFDGKRLLTVSGKNACLWDVETGKELQRFQGHGDGVRAVTFSPDGRYVLTGSGAIPDMGVHSQDHSARIWDVTTGKEVKRFQDDAVDDTVNKVQYSPDGSRVLTLGLNRKAVLWDINTGKELFAFSDVQKVDFDGSKIVGVNVRGSRVTVWDATTGKELFGIGENKAGHWFETTALDPLGKVLLTTASDGSVRAWDAKTGRMLMEFKGHANRVRQAVFAPRGEKVVTASSDGTVRWWNSKTGEQLKLIKYPGQVEQILLSWDEKRLLAKWNDELKHETVVTLSDAETGQEILRLPHDGAREVVGFSPNGKTFVTLEAERPATLRNAETGKVIREYAP
jgi:WD40 repeat protein